MPITCVGGMIRFAVSAPAMTRVIKVWAVRFGL